MDVITQLVAYLQREIPDIQILDEIPRSRPAAFIFVERIGGTEGDFRQFPTVQVSSWSVSEKAAEKMAYEISDKMNSFKYEPHICKCECNSFTSMPDPVTDTPRYQLFYNLITTY